MPQKKSTLIIVLLIVFFAIVLIGLGIVYVFYKNLNTTQTINKNENINTISNANKNSNINKNLNTNSKDIINENINTETTTEVSTDLNAIADLQLTNPDESDQAQYYDIGKIDEGKYNGYNLILTSVTSQGPAFYPSFYRFAKKDNEIILLAAQSDDTYGLDISKFKTDSTTTLSSLTYPEYLSGPKERQTLKLDSYANVLFSSEGLTVAFTDSEYGDIYTTKDETLAKDVLNQFGFYLKASDGTAKVYSLQIDFVDDNQFPNITWNDGSKNHDPYTFTSVGGCGPQDYAAVVTDPEVDLAKIGTNSKGDDILGFNDSNDPFLKNMYDNDYITTDDSEKMSYEDFIKRKPIIFWQDPFDRLIKAQNNTFNPPVECGKPVIYLYPETSQKISVKIDPIAGLSVSDPAYNSGWNVIADPNGDLFDLASQKKYPYLFWEGRSQSIYRTPEKGFVVEKNNIHNFLVNSLTKYNLNEKEIADFCEYWEPYLTESPYYFITFLGTTEMNKLAPLDIDPQPDTLIRVFMDFRPLQQSVPVEEYEIKSIPRSGFTAIEWGGTKK